MMEMSNELKAKLLAAKGVEEVAGILREAGREAAAEEAEHIYQEIEHTREDKDLSIDELEAVSGGADRDWLKNGCAATVEPGSWCGSDDYCGIWDVTYVHSPTSFRCKRCGGRITYYLGAKNSDIVCYDCGFIGKPTDFI